MRDALYHLVALVKRLPGARGLVADPVDEHRNQRGVTAVITAITLLVLLGMAAIAVDGSNLYRERGDAQNASDLAALAAAFAECTGGSEADAIVAGHFQAAANGYDDTDPDVTVVVVKEDPLWRATIDTTIDGYFSTILGIETLDTGATAVAQCDTTVVELPGLFAGGQCGVKTFEMSGSNDSINGAAHSNSDMKLNGGDLAFGDTTYVDNLDESGAPHTFTSGPDQVEWKDWPITHEDMNGVALSDFAPGGAVEAEIGADYHYAANWVLDSSTPDGVYVADETISVPDELDGSFTLIVLDDEGGFIEVSGQGSEMTAFYKDILIVSNGYLEGSNYPYEENATDTPKCDFESIKLSASDNTYTGLIFAPRGQITLSGQNIEVNGGVIGYTFKYNGSNLTLNPGTCCGEGGLVTILIR